MFAETQAWIERLQLLPHPEGGFFRETYRSCQIVDHPATGLPRPASTAILFMVTPESFSALHRLRSDEIWHHYGGDPLDLHVIDSSGGHRLVRLGAEDGPQAVVGAGDLQGARCAGDRFSLCGCTVAPGFEFGDLTIPARAELLATYPQWCEIVLSLTR